MVIMQCVTVILLCLLLIRSINHDDRMVRLEKFVSKVLASVREREEGMMSDQMFSGETIENFDDTEVDDGGKEREDF